MKKPKVEVEQYSLKAANGIHIRWATRVTLSDGRHIDFLDPLPQKQAIEQALKIINLNSANVPEHLQAEE